MARRRAAGREAEEAKDIEIGPDERDAVILFLSLSSQWRSHPMTGHRLGLDYPAIGPTAQMLGVVMTPDLFSDLRIMEGAALAAQLAK